jgi:hypothetical protein
MKYNVTVNCEYFTSQQQELCNGFSAVAVDGELYPTSNSPESKCEELEKAVKYNLLHVGLGSNITCLFMSYARSSPEIYVSEPLAVPGKYPNGNSKTVKQATDDHSARNIAIGVTGTVLVIVIGTVLIVGLSFYYKRRKWSRTQNTTASPASATASTSSATASAASATASTVDGLKI